MNEFQNIANITWRVIESAYSPPTELYFITPMLGRDMIESNCAVSTSSYSDEFTPTSLPLADLTVEEEKASSSSSYPSQEETSIEDDPSIILNETNLSDTSSCSNNNTIVSLVANLTFEGKDEKEDISSSCSNHENFHTSDSCVPVNETSLSDTSSDIPVTPSIIEIESPNLSKTDESLGLESEEAEILGEITSAGETFSKDSDENTTYRSGPSYTSSAAENNKYSQEYDNHEKQGNEMNPKNRKCNTKFNLEEFLQCLKSQERKWAVQSFNTSFSSNSYKEIASQQSLASSTTPKVYPIKRNFDLSKYKTELCRCYQYNKYCVYNESCLYAHGPEDLKAYPQHPKYRTKKCFSFHKRGFCLYGSRCQFLHNIE